MAYDLQEQEQLAAMKAWWNEYGKLVLLAVFSCLVAIAGYQGWRYYSHQQALAAVTLYDQLERAEKANETKKVVDIAAQITDRYSATPYAALAALTAAKAAFEVSDLGTAKARLRWVIERVREDEIRDVARLRLAGILLDEKNYGEALELLGGKHAEAFSGLYADLRGDVLVAQGKVAEARSAYQLAFDKNDPQSPYRTLLQAKLDALGEPK